MKVPVPMHSHDRSLLASLGFADADKRDRRHGLACRYLSLPENRAILLSIAGGQAWPSDRPIFEQPVVKGEGKYRSVVGFLDLVIPARFADLDHDGFSDGWVVVEVKINSVDVSDIIRQIKLYKTFLGVRTRWFVATVSRLSANDADVLASECICHIMLAGKFEAWMRAQASDDLNARSPEI